MDAGKRFSVFPKPNGAAMPLPIPNPTPVKKYPCPYGRTAGRVVICSRPPAETGAWPQSETITKDGWVVTGVFCRQRCPLYPKD